MTHAVAECLEPENIDKEFLQLWFAKYCDPYKDDTLPSQYVNCLARRYISLYEMITSQEFNFQEGKESQIVNKLNGLFLKYESEKH